MMVAWKESYFYRETADPEKVFQELDKLGDKKPRAIVEMARDPKTEVHKCFTWDVEKAAERCWIDEAQNMMNHLVVNYSVVSESNEQVEIMINAFTSIPGDEGRHYVKTTEGKDNEIVKQMIISEVRSLLSQAKNKMMSYEVFFNSKEVKEVEKLLEKLTKAAK